MKQSDFDKAIANLFKKHKITDNEALKLIERLEHSIKQNNRKRINDKVAGIVKVDLRPDEILMKES